MHHRSSSPWQRRLDTAQVVCHCGIFGSIELKSEAFAPHEPSVSPSGLCGTRQRYVRAPGHALPSQKTTSGEARNHCILKSSESHRFTAADLHWQIELSNVKQYAKDVAKDPEASAENQLPHNQLIAHRFPFLEGPWLLG